MEQSASGRAAPGGQRPELIGRVLSERYRIEELVASGAFGAVYRGLHLVMLKQVAIKILHPDIENFPELVERFEREAIAGAHVSHVNVAAATDIGKFDDGSYFLVQEYVRGETLRELMNRGPLPAGRAGRIARQIAEALGAAHRQGIVHRDLKPTNVMLVQDTEDFIKLIDFGLARVPVGALTEAPDEVPALERETSQPGVVFGTLAYLAPEAALGMQNVTERSDLYALGVMLYEMLAGRHPFDVSREPAEIFRQQRVDPVPAISERNPDVFVPNRLEAVVRCLLEKDPERRFADASVTIGALDAALSGDVEYDARTNPYSVRPSRFEDAEEEVPPDPIERSLQRAWGAVARRPRTIGLSMFTAGALMLVLVWGSDSPRNALPSAGASAGPSRPPPSAVVAEAFEQRYRRETSDELLSLAEAGDPVQAAGALLALVDLEAKVLSEDRIQRAAARVVARLPPKHGRTDAVFYALGHKSGPHGLDVLYRVTEEAPHTLAGKRAASILALAGVRDRGSPPLRVTWELRRAACHDKPALFERAGRDGDARTLRLLVPLQSRSCKPARGQCCIGRNLALDRAVELLRERTGAEHPP